MSSLKSIFPNGFPVNIDTPVLPPEHQLRVHMSENCIQAPESIIPDGKLHRFATGSKKGDLSGWYVLHDGKVPAGVYGDWKTGEEYQFRANIGRELTFQENIAHVKQINELKAKREKELSDSREYAAYTATKIWDAAQLASDDHPYIKRKGISNPGWRIAPDGRLIAPMLIDGDISGLQYISDDGTKMFMKGSKTGGAYWSIGPVIDSTGEGRIYICEGIATGASIFEATGNSVVISFSSGNMAATAQALRHGVGPLREIVIVADNDESGTGLKEATKAANLIAAMVCMPPMPGDANDYAQAGHDLGELLEPTESMTAATERLNVVFADNLGSDFIAPDELVEGVITVGASSVVYGDSNSGKTFFVLDMGCAIARGVEWMGRKTEPGLVIYLATEAPASIKTRLQAYQKYHDCTVPNFAIVQTPVNFHRDMQDAKDIVTMIEDVEKALGQKARLIVGDTLARISSGANENSGDDMGPIMERFDYLARKTGAHVLIIHHNGKDAAKGARGWSGIRAHIDTEIELVDDKGVRSATITKQRELGGKGDVIGFKLDIVDMGLTKWGKTATSCVVVEDTDATVKSDEKESKSTAEARNSFSGALLKYGYIDYDHDLYITTDSWSQYEKETKRHIKEATAAQNVTKTTRYPEYLKDSIEPKNGGYRVTNESKFHGIRLILKSR